jgi:hypothetical protein
MPDSQSSTNSNTSNQHTAFKSIGAEEYISKRVDQYIQWYDNKSVRMKSMYFRLRASSVVGAAVVPVLVNISIPYLNIITTAISLAVVIIVSLESVYHYGDQWKNYRSTEQFLSREKVIFQAGNGRYRDLSIEDAFMLFVERCEAQIAAENSATLNVLAVAAQPPEKEGAIREGATRGA